MMATAGNRIHDDANDGGGGGTSSRSSPCRPATPMLSTETTTPSPDGDISQTKQPYKVSTRRRLTTTVQTQHPDLTTKEGHTPKVTYVSFVCGITAGVVQAGLFNPWDRALYLSIKNDVPFLSYQNFRNPYTGFLQSVGHRALSGGLYYPLEQFFCSLLFLPTTNDGNTTTTTTTTTTDNFFHRHPALSNFIAGTLAGSANAIIVNPLTAIKYKSWGRDVNRGLLPEAIEMFHKGGIRPFCNGLIPTVLRDLVFGGCYTFGRLEIQYRLQLQPDQQWFANMTAAAFATIVSGPFNLVRNVQYATKSRHVADTVRTVLANFVAETQSRPALSTKIKFVQSRLRIGWGTVRVAVGMSFGHYIYDKMMGYYEDKQLEEQYYHHAK
jgi:hypothetical protein